MIPLTKVVVDNLHMFLRVTDASIDLLLLELRRLDSIERLNRKSLDRLHHLKKYEEALKVIGIRGSNFWIGKESKKLKWRTLTGPEKLLLFDNINLCELFPQVPNINTVQSLWKDLLVLNRLLSTRPGSISDSVVTEFERRATMFVRSFTDIYPSKFVTPYMYCMLMCHVSQFMKVHGAILPCTQHGMEKYNDVMTKDYF